MGINLRKIPLLEEKLSEYANDDIVIELLQREIKRLTASSGRKQKYEGTPEERQQKARKAYKERQALRKAVDAYNDPEARAERLKEAKGRIALKKGKQRGRSRSKTKNLWKNHSSEIN